MRARSRMRMAPLFVREPWWRLAREFQVERCPRTVADIEVEVAKLRSVSMAGRRWIVDSRCRRERLGRWQVDF